MKKTIRVKHLALILSLVLILCIAVGGTIAYISALYGMDVVDAGIAVLNMHAPFEAVSKADVYEAFRCYTAFLKDMD